MPLKLKMKIHNILSDDLRAPCTEFSCLMSARLRETSIVSEERIQTLSAVLTGRMVNLGFDKKNS